MCVLCTSILHGDTYLQYKPSHYGDTHIHTQIYISPFPSSEEKYRNIIMTARIFFSRNSEYFRNESRSEQLFFVHITTCILNCTQTITQWSIATIIEFPRVLGGEKTTSVTKISPREAIKITAKSVENNFCRLLV